MKNILQPLVKQFMPFAQERMGFDKPPRLFLRNDTKNAQNPLGKTAYYDPEQMSVTLYIDGRHPKDIMRSLSHELVHHTQNCNGQFNHAGEMGEGYAQNDEHWAIIFFCRWTSQSRTRRSALCRSLFFLLNNRHL